MDEQISVEFLGVLSTDKYENLEKVWLPGKQGNMTIMPRHDSLVTELRDSDVTLFFKNGETKELPVKNSFAIIEKDKIIVFI